MHRFKIYKIDEIGWCIDFSTSTMLISHEILNIPIPRTMLWGCFCLNITKKAKDVLLDTIELENLFGKIKWKDVVSFCGNNSYTKHEMIDIFNRFNIHT